MLSRVYSAVWVLLLVIFLSVEGQSSASLCIDLFGNNYAIDFNSRSLQRDLWEFEENNPHFGAKFRAELETSLRQVRGVKVDKERFNPEGWDHKRPSSNPYLLIYPGGIHGIYKRFLPLERGGNLFEKIYNRFNSPHYEIAAYVKKAKILRKTNK